MRLPKIAKVAVEQAAFHFDKFYDYCLPEALEPVEPGCRVLFPSAEETASVRGW